MKLFYARVKQDLTNITSVTEITSPRKSSINAVVLGFEPTITLAATVGVKRSANWAIHSGLYSFTNSPYILPYNILYSDDAVV